MRVKKRKIKRLIMLELGILLISALFFFYLLQRYWAHREDYFFPDYPKDVLTEAADYETIFLQTGLGPSAIDKLLAEGDFERILEAQENFFNPPSVSCTPLLGGFTREDRVNEVSDNPFVDLQPGDIVVTLSTHSCGWRHGHAALVIDEETTLECMVLGTDSTLGNIDNWSSYANYAVLRVKDVTPVQQELVTEYALNTLYGVPYHLSAGLIKSKAPSPEEPYFGLQCSYLPWYAWNHYGCDIDGNGGRLVLTEDLLYSEELEVVQLYGLDPREFIVR